MSNPPPEQKSDLLCCTLIRPACNASARPRTNAHRIHYDTAYARAEGLADRVVMAQLHGTLFFRAATRYVGDPDAVLSVGWQNRAPAYVGTTLTVTGTVREVHDDRIVLGLEERDSDGTLCAAGEAVVARR